MSGVILTREISGNKVTPSVLCFEGTYPVTEFPKLQWSFLNFLLTTTPNPLSPCRRIEPIFLASQVALVLKNPPCQCRRCKINGLIPGSGADSLESRECVPTHSRVFLPGEHLYGQNYGFSSHLRMQELNIKEPEHQE